ncbi:hypothetical protein pb186bvf_001365 [Paramecium bursaria]
MKLNKRVSQQIMYFSYKQYYKNKINCGSHSFQFPLVFDQQVDQEQVYLQLGTQLIHEFLNKNSINFMIYGSQNSGKTYCLFGTIGSLFSLKQGLISIDCGLLFRILFQLVEKGVNFGIEIVVIENEKVSPVFLFNEFDHYQQINPNGVWAEMCKILYEPIRKLLSQKNHIVITIKNNSAFLRLLLVSSLQKTNQQNNKSLYTLKRCIYLLEQKNNLNYMPVRESKLTKILYESLTGTIEMRSLLCLSPINSEECIGTLNFGVQLQALIQTQSKVEITRQQLTQSDISQTVYQQSVSSDYISIAQHQKNYY